MPRAASVSGTLTVVELFDTKAQARERIFTVRKFKGVTFVELRAPSGALWFRDHFFEGATK